MDQPTKPHTVHRIPRSTLTLCDSLYATGYLGGLNTAAETLIDHIEHWRSTNHGPTLDELRLIALAILRHTPLSILNTMGDRIAIIPDPPGTTPDPFDITTLHPEPNEDTK
jgi:hypothetical protein